MVLLDYFKQINSLTIDEAKIKLYEVEIDVSLKNALLQAIEGDSSAMNDWLFSTKENNLVWLAPVVVDGKKKFAWMIGTRSPYTKEMLEMLSEAHNNTKNDPLLIQKRVTKPLLFIRPQHVSEFAGWEQRRNTDKDEFAIFQTGYNREIDRIDDFDQRLALNVEHLVEYRKKAFNRYSSITQEDLICNIELYALLHSETHNQGHFVGAWEFGREKDSVLYECIEEFKACASGIQILANHNSFNVTLFAKTVLATRFLGYAYDAFVSGNRRREEAREMTVGGLFFVVGYDCGAITWNGTEMSVDGKKYLKALRYELEVIKKVESERSMEALANYSKTQYARLYPNKDYHPMMIEIFQKLQNSK